MIGNIVNKFKNSNGVLLTKSLFFETSLTRDTVLYTLKHFDHTVDGKTYPSLKMAYLEAKDTSEHIFAVQYLYNYPHWLKMCSQSWFEPYVTEWREELRLLLLSEAEKRIQKIALKDDANGLAAQKYLHQLYGKAAGRPTAGRPRKGPDLKQIAEKASFEAQQVEEEFQRIIQPKGMN